MTDSKHETPGRIFCAIDFSDTCEVAIEQAKRFARRHRGVLVLAHVVEPLPMGPYPAITTPDAERMILGLAREKLEARAATLRDEGFHVETMLEEGAPGSTLVAMAEASGANLLVIGTRGLSNLMHLVMGSTADHVVRRSPCPVLAVHPDDSVLHSAIESVVLPTDFSDGAAHAIEAFIALFGEWARPHVLLLHADRTPPYLAPFKHELLAKMDAPDVAKDEIEKKLAPIADHLRAADFEVEVGVFDGDPVSVTTRLAKERAADLILMSTKGRGAIANALIGRTAQRIVQHAPCPVLTVRPAED